ncbi:uncharacterized protein PHACADRAFT_189325 [Phanerochaete carnosa HHB-10118-sp]|uniref:Uncharacterized protein n=1 Tax=Phanerochaete carnosa (strain HHB-10118-sp) TaxID=650164 RepID=K5XB75_PHACS|nr:uncharacterized protein PHACADRAFT_189325 [Phanerochaete carnosa HHB-10118-sp]EKM60197.1 hypothetical protein PHACADRAFT_189325 [Phanerochaete carnosa HHB-10118-sp]
MNVLELLTYSNMLLVQGTYASIFVQSMPPLLVQRFILNLRQLSHTGQASSASIPDEQHLSRIPVSFRRSLCIF